MQKYNFNNILKIGSRKSPLALFQAKTIAKKISLRHRIVKISTSGDKIVDENLSNLGGKGLFTKELEEALINQKIDIAVHSLKDVPTFISKKFNLHYILRRENSQDVLISKANIKNILQLTKNNTIGTSSPRRISQIKRLNPKVKIVPLRGNVETRIKKIRDKKLDATILALAGIKRLKITKKYVPLNTYDFMPAAGQGIIAIQTIKDNYKINELLNKLEIKEVMYQAEAERSVLKTLKADCNSSISILSKIDEDQLYLNARIFSPDGKKVVETNHKGHIYKYLKIGKSLGQDLINKGGLGLLNL